MEKLAQHIRNFAYQTGKDNKQVLDDLLTYIIGAFNPERQPDPTWKYTKEQNGEFFSMMQEYFLVMQKELTHLEWFDAWGDLFMALTPKGGSKGQFFTPVSLCNLLADVTDKPMEAEAVCNGFGKRVTVCDPAAGSSRNLLAAHATFIKNNREKPYLIAEDVDAMCCKMSAINMMVHGCYGEVICHDTLGEPKNVRIGYIVNEGMYPLQPGFPTIRIKTEPEYFVCTRRG